MAEPALCCLAPSTRFLSSISANPVCNSSLHTQEFGLSWREQVGAAQGVGYDVGIGACSFYHGPTHSPDGETPQRA